MRFYYLLLCFFLCQIQLWGQDDPRYFSGMVVNELDTPLVGAVVYWAGTTNAATTDGEGWFTLERPDTVQAHQLVIQYLGYEESAVEILPDEERLRLIINSSALELVDITVTANEAGTPERIHTFYAQNVEVLGQGELGRAACCNLGESFENVATVNIMSTDAVTGAREIEMLGLRGTYTQMMLENRPMFNRLGRIFGLDYLPGTFIEQISLSKGASSVKNGPQSIAGQINTELIKPYTAPLLFVNFYANNFGRFELNTQWNYRLTETWSAGLLVHGDWLGTTRDDNGDNFADLPQKRQLNAIGRLFFKPKKWHVEWSLQGILDEREGGQIAPSQTPEGPQRYAVNNAVQRLGTFGKVGFLGFDKRHQSLALIYDLHTHQHQGQFGSRHYWGSQQRLYLNPMYQMAPGAEDLLTVGLTYEWVQLQEGFDQLYLGRQEQWRSAYAQYSRTIALNTSTPISLTILAGLRADWLVYEQENRVYPVPRLNLSLRVGENWIFRGSAGRGVRLPTLLAESVRFLASDRQVHLPDAQQSLTEDALNYGLNMVWNYRMTNAHNGILSIDAYRTDFNRQILVDVCSDPSGTRMDLIPLDGVSYSNSLLVALTQYFFYEQWELRLAYKYTDAQATMGGVLQRVPFQPEHRGLVHLAWHTRKKNWSASVTLNVVGPQRLPPMSFRSDVPRYYLVGSSPSFATLNAHVVKHFGDQWEVYLGGENLTNYLQPQPIVGAAQPFAPFSFFDASLVYGPTATRRIYVGFKYRLQGKKRFETELNCGS